MDLLIRDRPFNLKGGGELWFFVSFRIFFSDNTRVRIFIYFVAQNANFFSQNLTLGYMTKTLNQIIFFPSSTKIRIFFSATLGIRIFFFVQNLTLGYMTKTLNHIIFFFLHQNQNIFFSNIGNQNVFFRKKNITPPPPSS